MRAIARGRRREARGVHEVRDDLDRNRGVERKPRVGLPFQKLGRDSDAVRLAHGEPGRREIRRIASDLRHVAAVKGGHDAKGTGSQHLAGQIGARRVRDGVVHVHDVEPMLARDMDEARCQRQTVRRVDQRRVPRRGHLVHDEPFGAHQAPGKRRADDDVHRVPALGQPGRELGRHGAAPSEAREADDADRVGGVHG